jgi:hypothetical protein
MWDANGSPVDEEETLTPTPIHAYLHAVAEAATASDARAALEQLERSHRAVREMVRTLRRISDL